MKKSILRVIIVIISVIILSKNTIAMAASEEAQKLQTEQNLNNKKITEAESNLQEVKAEKTETLKQVESLDSKISEYEEQIIQLDNQIEEYSAKIEESEAQIVEKQKDYTKREQLLEARLVATYEAGDTSYLDVLLSSESITDLISNYYLVTELATADSEVLENIQKEKDEIEKAKQTLEESKRELDTSKASKQSVSLQLQTSKNEKNSYVNKLSEDEKAIQSQIDELQTANVKINQEIIAANKRYEAKLEELRRQQESNNSGASNSSTSASTSTSSSGFIKPVNSYITTNLYYSSGQYHGAVDYGAPGINGMPVYAVADAVVYKTAALTSSYGNYIILRHTNGLYTLYAHGQAGSISVSEGQIVKQGQQIMRVGNTGNSTGPHLHFEVRTSPGGYNNRVNPLNYLP